MGNVWLTSDLHLGHPHVAMLRGFIDPDETDARAIEAGVNAHDALLCRRYSKMVRDRDEVWFLGDLALGGWRERIAVISSLTGVKRCVLGNHDRAHPSNSRGHAHLQVLNSLFVSVTTSAKINFKGVNVLLSHFPYSGDHGEERFDQWRLRDLGVPILHGHTHSAEKVSLSLSRTTQIHVGLDAWGMRPVLLADALRAGNLL